MSVASPLDLRRARAARRSPATRSGRRISAQRLVRAELAPPGLGDPVGVGVLERGLVRPCASGRAAIRSPSSSASRRITAFANGTARSRPARRTSSTDSLTAACRRHRVEVAELVGAEPKRRPDGRVELAHGPAADRLERVVERADALHGAVREPLGERAVARVELRPRRCGARGRRRRPPRTRGARPRRPRPGRGRRSPQPAAELVVASCGACPRAAPRPGRACRPRAARARS